MTVYELAGRDDKNIYKFRARGLELLKDQIS